MAKGEQVYLCSCLTLTFSCCRPSAGLCCETADYTAFSLRHKTPFPHTHIPPVPSSHTVLKAAFPSQVFLSPYHPHQFPSHPTPFLAVAAVVHRASRTRGRQNGAVVLRAQASRQRALVWHSHPLHTHLLHTTLALHRLLSHSSPT